PGGLEGEDGASDLTDRLVEVLHGLEDPTGGGGGLDGSDGALQSEAGGEQTLDHRVVEVGGDALAVLDQGELADPGQQAGVLDGDSGRTCQRYRQDLVILGELGCALL